MSFKYPKEIAPYVPAVGPGDGSVPKPTIINGGSGYTSQPTVTFSAPDGAGGTTATGTAVVANGAVTEIQIIAAGKGYTSDPTITISGGGGTGASATATANRAAQPAQIQQMQLEVPILTMLPIPYIRVETTTIDFNAKITSVEYRKTDESVRVDAALEAKAGWAWGSARLNVSASYQKTTQTGANVDRTYTLGVHISAVQDEMPAAWNASSGSSRTPSRRPPPRFRHPRPSPDRGSAVLHALPR